MGTNLLFPFFFSLIACALPLPFFLHPPFMARVEGQLFFSFSSLASEFRNCYLWKSLFFFLRFLPRWPSILPGLGNRLVERLPFLFWVTLVFAFRIDPCVFLSFCPD